MNLSLSAMSIALPKLARHPNRLPFRGVLTVLDVPSDRAPAGARGHRVLLTRAAAEAALPSLLGMALDYTPALDGHDARRKIGIITSADIHPLPCHSERPDYERSEWGAKNLGERPARGEQSEPPNAPTRASLSVAGYLFARDFPEIVRELRGQASIGLNRSALIVHSEERRDEEALPLRSTLGQVAVPRLTRDLTKRRATQDHLHASSEQKRQPTAEAPPERSLVVDRRPTTLGQRPTTNDQRPLLAMSYEIADVRVEDTRAAIWILTEVIFTGAAVLRRDKAAYHNTWIALEA